MKVHSFPPGHNRSLRGVLANRIQGSVAQEDWQKTCEEAWCQAVAECDDLKNVDPAPPRGRPAP
jgi:hypothetical protein